MSSEHIVVVLYILLASAVVLLPLRWSLVAYLLLTTVDFGQRSTHIGLLNAGKAIVLPLFLLWRLRRYAGHHKILLAPIAWLLLTIYAALAASWSFYPALGLKLAGHMLASLLICCVLLRASKGGDLQPGAVVPVAIGVLLIAAIRSLYAPGYGEESSRFTTFSSAQSFAALLVALYCVALCSKALSGSTRVALCLSLSVALLFDGSRIWALGLVLSSVLAFLISNIRSWVKICTVGAVLILTTIVAGAADPLLRLLSEHAQSNRIAAAISAAFAGDMASAGLGTFRFRRALTAIVMEQMRKSSAIEFLVGHGTSNGAVMATSRLQWLDPNRFFHNEWLRVIYDWGVVGVILFSLFLASVTAFALRGSLKDNGMYAKPLLVYLPAFLLGLTGENIMAGAGNAVSVGFLLLIAFASIAYRRFVPPDFPESSPRLRASQCDRFRQVPALSGS